MKTKPRAEKPLVVFFMQRKAVSFNLDFVIFCYFFNGRLYKADGILYNTFDYACAAEFCSVYFARKEQV